MKVLHINGSFLLSGLHRLLVEAISATGIEQYVFVPTEKCERSISDDSIHSFGCFRYIDRFLFFLKQSKICKTIDEKTDLNEYDIIHAHTLFTDGNVARKMAKKYGIHYVVAVRNTDINHFFKIRKLLIRVGIKCLMEANRVIFLSPAYKDYLLDKIVPTRYRRIIAEKSIVIPNGIDSFWIKNLNMKRKDKDEISEIRRKKVKVISVGELDRNKNMIFVAETINEMNNEGWSISLVIAGREKESRLAHELCLYPFVEYVGQKEKEDLINIYRQGDVFALLSHHETFGLVYAEAMSQGLPIIYTRGQGFDGQFDEGEVGFSSSDYDHNELKLRLTQIIEDYERLSYNAIAGVKKFSWDSIAYTYREIYNDVY